MSTCAYRAGMHAMRRPFVRLMLSVAALTGIPSDKQLNRISKMEFGVKKNFVEKKLPISIVSSTFAYFNC